MKFSLTGLLTALAINCALFAMEGPADENIRKNITLITVLNEKKVTEQCSAQEFFGSKKLLWDQIKEHLTNETPHIEGLFEEKNIEVIVNEHSLDLGWAWLWQTYYMPKKRPKTISVQISDSSNSLTPQEISVPGKGIIMPGLTSWIILSFVGTYGGLKLLEKIVALKTPSSLKIV